MLDPEVEYGLTLVARPPDPSCPACRGTGKIRDKHSYLGPKRQIGATDEAERQGHSAPETEDSLLAVFPTGGWRIDADIRSTGNRPGRPKTTIHDLGVAQIYLVDVANEVVAEHAWILELESQEDFLLALDILTNILFARAPSANPRVLAPWLGRSKDWIYRRRKRGKMVNPFETMEEVKTLVEQKIATDNLRWEMLFRELHGVTEDELTMDEHSPWWTEETPPETKP